MPLVLVLIVPAITAFAAGPPAVELHASIGWDGWVSPDAVTPLRVDLRSAVPLDGILVVEVPSGTRGGLPVRHVRPVRIPAGGRQQAHLDVIVRDPRRPIVIAVRDPQRERARQELRIGVDHVAEGVVAALTREDAGLEFLAGLPGRRRAAYLTEAELPVRWQAYDVIDLLILRDLEVRVVLPAQERAVVEWIAQGGRLLVVAPHRAHLDDAAWLRQLLPSGGRRAHGRGIVEVAVDDLFTADRRAGGDLRRAVLALLDLPRPPAAADVSFASVLPTTRPLPGGTQLGLAVLSVLYIVAVRLLLPRFGRARSGWIVFPVLIAASTAAFHGVASSARSAATSVAQLSVAEMLGTLGQAHVTTYASIIALYGGDFAVRVPEGATARALTDDPLTYDEAGREIRGIAPAGQLSLIARQIVPLRLSARLPAPDVLALDRASPALHGAVLYRQRQLYRLPADRRATIRLDPGSWEPVDRPGILGGDVTGRAMDLLFKQLDRFPDATWLIGRLADDRLGVRTGRAGGGDAVVLAVVEVQ